MKSTITIILLMILVFCEREASAFWGTDTTETASGLNMTEGFDINTITTVAGTVVTLPERRGQEQQTLMTVAAPQGTVTVMLGPWWYWEKQTFAVSRNQEVVTTGSFAQGKDGALYLFAQKVEIQGTGEVILLRSETGKPLWSRSGSVGQNGSRHDGSGRRSGWSNRGTGMRGGRR